MDRLRLVPGSMVVPQRVRQESTRAGAIDAPARGCADAVSALRRSAARPDPAACGRSRARCRLVSATCLRALRGPGGIARTTFGFDSAHCETGRLTPIGSEICPDVRYGANRILRAGKE